MGDIATSLTVGDVAEHLNIPTPTGSQDAEFEGFLLAADAHVSVSVGPVINVLRTESVAPSDWALWVSRVPVLSVTSVTQGTMVYTSGITFNAESGRVYFPQVNSGRWDVVYRSGWLTFPADLRVAVLEDIRGLQRGQLGPPGAIGAFGMDPLPTPSGRPVTMWPRTDLWIEAERKRWYVGVA